jgi:hypothetical protein
MLTLDSKMRDVVKNEAAMDILEEYFPGARKEPKLKMAMGMSLNTVAKMAPKMFPPEMMKDIERRFAELGD